MRESVGVGAAGPESVIRYLMRDIHSIQDPELRRAGYGNVHSALVQAGYVPRHAARLMEEAEGAELGSMGFGLQGPKVSSFADRFGTSVATMGSETARAIRESIGRNDPRLGAALAAFNYPRAPQDVAADPLAVAVEQPPPDVLGPAGTRVMSEAPSSEFPGAQMYAAPLEFPNTQMYAAPDVPPEALGYPSALRDRVTRMYPGGRF